MGQTTCANLNTMTVSVSYAEPSFEVTYPKQLFALMRVGKLPTDGDTKQKQRLGLRGGGVHAKAFQKDVTKFDECKTLSAVLRL